MLPPTGGRGVGMAPSLTGRGWGWVVFFAAEAVSRSPGPPLEDPPTSPPRNSTGARGGSAVGRLAHGLPLPHGRHSVAADVPACLAQRLQCSRPNDHEQRQLCGRRATKGAEGERLARRSSRCEHFNEFGLQRPGYGLGGCPGWRSGRASTERSELRAARSPSGRRSCAAGRTKKPAIPAARERGAACLSRLCRPDRVANEMNAPHLVAGVTLSNRRKKIAFP